jgi:hypothetical protein
MGNSKMPDVSNDSSGISVLDRQRYAKGVLLVVQATRSGATAAIHIRRSQKQVN